MEQEPVVAAVSPLPRYVLHKCQDRTRPVLTTTEDKMRITPESRVVRSCSGKRLEQLAEGGSFFKAAAQREITRRENKAKKRAKKGGGA